MGKCDCSESPQASLPPGEMEVELSARGAMSSNGEGPLPLRTNLTAVSHVGHPDNCAERAYDFCCAVGTPCDCDKSASAPGQCESASWWFCCEFGTPCDCHQPLVQQNVSVI